MKPVPHSLRVPITNVFAEGGFCARLYLGSHHKPVHLILDTGSSSLVVEHEVYDAHNDKARITTSLVQAITYGKGGWYGPLIKTRVGLGLAGHALAINDAPVAIVSRERTDSFLQADGILGLAYCGLNHAVDMQPFLQKLGLPDNSSYPYFLQHHDDNVSEFKKFIKQYPPTTVTPYFTDLEQEGVVANQFGLLTHRSSIYHPKQYSLHDELVSHHNNHGLFVLGAPHVHVDLYQPPLITVAVHDDKYYNVELAGVHVGNSPLIPAPALAEKDVAAFRTNAIVDSGACAIVLPEILFEQVKAQFKAINPEFEHVLSAFGEYTGNETGIDAKQVDLCQWPDIHFYFLDEQQQTVTLTMSPDTYWQVNAPAHGQISFKICTLTGWPNQVILGLPLLNNYYTIFDRDAGEKGVVRFAKPRALCNEVRQSIKHAFTGKDNNL